MFSLFGDPSAYEPGPDAEVNSTISLVDIVVTGLSKQINSLINLP